MIQAYYESYYDKSTNFENSHKLITRSSDRSVANKLIGLNLVYVSFQMIKEDIKSSKKGDETFRMAQAMNVSLGLNELINNIFNKHYNLEEVIDFLKINIETNSKGLPYQVINEHNIRNHHLYELGAIFYIKSRKFESLGNGIYEFLKSNSTIKSLFGELEIAEGRIHEYESDHLNYPNLLGMIDGIKARIFRQEESIMRFQLMQELGVEF